MANMNNPPEIETILDFCIDEMRTGKSVDYCLAQFPEYREELEPLLEMAGQIGELDIPEPSATAINQALFEIGRRTPAQPEKPFNTGARGLFKPAWFRWTANVLAAVILLFFGFSTASADSVPGDILYPFKLLTERVQIILTFSSQNKADLHLAFSEQRLKELSELYRTTGRVDRELIRAMLNDGAVALEVHQAGVNQPSYLMTRARHLNDTQKDFLSQLQRRVRGADREVVEQAIQTCNQRGQQMQEMMRGMMKNMPLMHNGGKMPGMHGMMPQP